MRKITTYKSVLFSDNLGLTATAKQRVTERSMLAAARHGSSWLHPETAQRSNDEGQWYHGTLVREVKSIL